MQGISPLLHPPHRTPCPCQHLSSVPPLVEQLNPCLAEDQHDETNYKEGIDVEVQASAHVAVQKRSHQQSDPQPHQRQAKMGGHRYRPSNTATTCVCNCPSSVTLEPPSRQTIFQRYMYWSPPPTPSVVISRSSSCSTPSQCPCPTPPCPQVYPYTYATHKQAGQLSPYDIGVVEVEAEAQAQAYSTGQEYHYHHTPRHHHPSPSVPLRVQAQAHAHAQIHGQAHLPDDSPLYHPRERERERIVIPPSTHLIWKEEQQTPTDLQKALITLLLLGLLIAFLVP